MAWLLGVEPGGVLAALASQTGDAARIAWSSEIRSLAAHYNSDDKPTRRGSSWHGRPGHSNCSRMLRTPHLPSGPPMCGSSAIRATQQLALKRRRRMSQLGSRNRRSSPNFAAGPRCAAALWPQSDDGSFERAISRAGTSTRAACRRWLDWGMPSLTSTSWRQTSSAR